MPVPSPAMTLAEREKRERDIVADEAVRGGEHQPAEAGAGAAAGRIGDALDGKGRRFRRQGRFLQLVGRHFGGVEQVEVARLF